MTRYKGLTRRFLLGELIANDGYGQGDHQNSKGSTDGPGRSAQESSGGQVTIAHSRHGDQSPPVSVQHRHETRVLLVILKDVDQGGEDQDSHEEEEEQHPQLSVAVPNWWQLWHHTEYNSWWSIITCLSKGFQGPNMSGQLEDSDDPKEFDDSQQSEELSNSHDLSWVAAAWIVFILVGGVLSGLCSDLSIRHEQLITRNNPSDKYQIWSILYGRSSL